MGAPKGAAAGGVGAHFSASVPGEAQPSLKVAEEVRRSQGSPRQDSWQSLPLLTDLLLHDAGATSQGHHYGDTSGAPSPCPKNGTLPTPVRWSPSVPPLLVEHQGTGSSSSGRDRPRFHFQRRGRTRRRSRSRSKRGRKRRRRRCLQGRRCSGLGVASCSHRCRHLAPPASLLPAVPGALVGLGGSGAGLHGESAGSCWGV